MHADPDGGEGVTIADVVDYGEAKPDRVSGVGAAEHDCVADRLYLRRLMLIEDLPAGIREPTGKVGRVVITMEFGQRRKAGEVRKDKGLFSDDWLRRLDESAGLFAKHLDSPWRNPSLLPAVGFMSMTRDKELQLQGDLQVALMHVLWDKGRASVQEARQQLPPRYRKGAYTTVQTVLNRLAERGLIMRERVGKVIYYEPRISEADYYSGSLRRTLAPVSEEARRAVLAQLVGELDPGELDLDALAREIEQRRQKWLR